MKIIFLKVGLALSLFFCGCGNKNEKAQSNEAQPNPEKSAETITVDEGLLDVTILLPNSFFESLGSSAEEFVNSTDDEDNKKFKKVEILEDHSVRITLNKVEYKLLMEELEKSINNNLQELLDNPEYAFETIEHDKKFENFTVTLSSEEVGFVEGFLVVGFMMNGGIYQLFDGNQKPHVVVTYQKSDGTVLNTWDSTTMNNYTNGNSNN